MAKEASKTPAPGDDSFLVNDCLNISNYMYYAQHANAKFSETPLYDNPSIDLEPLRVDGQILEKTDASAGLFEEAFITPGKGSNRQVVIGYEGTDLNDKENPHYHQFTGGQVVGDSYIVAGQTNTHPSSGFQGAASFARTVLGVAQGMGLKRSNVVLTGHSLGAAEAEYASASTGLSGYTFGTPGIVAPAAAKKSNLTNFVDYGDPVANYANDGQNAYGPQKYYSYYDEKYLHYPAIILNNSIKHYEGPTMVGPKSNYDDLYDAIEDYNEGYDLNALDDFDDALDYHALSNYASDLTQAGYNNIDLYKIKGASDLSASADSNFFSLLPAPRNAIAEAAACYAGGTRILTPEGDVAIESLKAGDLVVTASGEARPIRWLGHRTIDAGRHPRPHEVMPIKIAAHAVAANRPSRDLFVSPGHSICLEAVDEVLLPASALINGTTISQVAVDSVTYWHVELDSHDILLAENLPAESYLEMGNRGFFAESEAVALHAGPDARVATPADFCRRFADGGLVLEAIRARLAMRATGAVNHLNRIEIPEIGPGLPRVGVFAKIAAAGEVRLGERVRLLA